MSFFISQAEANRKLTHPNNLLVKHSNLGSGNHNEHGNSGRNKGSKNYSTEIKVLIGLLAKADGVKETSEKTGIAISQVSHYKNGKTQVKEGIRPDPELRKKLREEETLAAEDLKRIVRQKIEGIVGSIDADKIKDLSVVQASKAASNLAAVYDKFGDKVVPINAHQQFVFYGVDSKAEEEYNVVEAEVVNRG